MGDSNGRSALNRRSFLVGGAALTGGAAVAGGAAGWGVGGRTATARTPDRDAIANSRAVGAATEPFHGDRQSGITTAPQAHAAYMAFDLRDGVRRTDLIGVLRAWTQDAARLTQGRGGLADLQHELAEGPSRLTVTIGFGPELLGKIGLGDRTPEWLQPLPDFPQ
ncbi:MAG: Dyp-type peroxidase domain-containing protein, partial [Dietzia maris]